MSASVAFATATTLASEAALALYPILIKTVPVSLQTQLLARLGTYTVAAAALAPAKEWSIPFSASSVGLGLMNFTHILASYLSYLYLPAGTALALFYTYPFFNILAGLLFLGDRFRPWAVPLLLLAFVGVVLIALYTKGTEGFASAEAASADTEGSSADRDRGTGTSGNRKGGAGRDLQGGSSAEGSADLSLSQKRPLCRSVSVSVSVTEAPLELFQGGPVGSALERPQRRFCDLQKHRNQTTKRA